MKLVRHKQHPGMFYVQWPDGSMSADFYNKVRAKEIMKREGILDYEVGKTYNNPLGRTETGSTGV